MRCSVDQKSRFKAAHGGRDLLAGLGGSGPLNLFITNLGFGEEVNDIQMPPIRTHPIPWPRFSKTGWSHDASPWQVETFKGGVLRGERNAGQDAKDVDFFLDDGGLPPHNIRTFLDMQAPRFTAPHRVNAH